MRKAPPRASSVLFFFLPGVIFNVVCPSGFVWHGRFPFVDYFIYKFFITKHTILKSLVSSRFVNSVEIWRF